MTYRDMLSLCNLLEVRDEKRNKAQTGEGGRMEQDCLFKYEYDIQNNDKLNAGRKICVC
jgi:hypothetical protein